MCRSSIIQGFRIKPACVSEASVFCEDTFSLASSVGNRKSGWTVFTATERGLKNPRTDFLIKINGVDI